MAPLSSLSLILTGLASLVAGHGFLKSITVNGKDYLAWQVFQDDYVTPTPVRYARKLADNGPVPDFTTKNITYAPKSQLMLEQPLIYVLAVVQGGTSPPEASSS
jgi:hypothetical protein